MRAVIAALTWIWIALIGVPGEVGAEAPAAALDADIRPPLLRDVGLDAHLGATLPLELAFRDEEGTEVSLGRYLGARPAVLALVYYGCPMLCGQLLTGLAASLKSLALEPGRDFDVVVVSFDPRDGPEEARRRKGETVARYGRPATAAGWHFLTGDTEAIRRLTMAVGFRYAWDDGGKQFAHVAMLTLLTPDGRIARYFQGIEYPPRELRLGLVEASDGRIGTVVDRLLLFCYRYDASTGRYTPIVESAVRIGAVLGLVALGTLLVVLRRGEPGRAA